MKKQTQIHWNGKLQSVSFTRRGLDIWFHIAGATHCISMDSKIKKAIPGGGVGLDGEYAAPMPGKIMKILVETGQVVTAGQSLLVMEAMKMEYRIEAQADGVVSDLIVEEEQQVALGDTLIKVDLEEG